MLNEARTMEYLTRQGYPVPAVDQVSADGCDLFMQRVEGPSMVNAVAHAPWTIFRQADVLAGLHRRLHELDPPDFLPAARIGAGDRIVHLDLHPLNVIIGGDGPVVIVWTSACIGDPVVDVGLAWILMSAGEIPGGVVARSTLGLGRSLMVRRFVQHFDREEIVQQLPAIITWKARDPHMSPDEISAMWHVTKRAGPTRTSHP